MKKARAVKLEELYKRFGSDDEELDESDSTVTFERLSCNQNFLQSDTHFYRGTLKCMALYVEYNSDIYNVCRASFR